mmetsp:Transcript_17734/g.68786  ORF Transcript_17734/g.68786 Transcript_17734/m.68786 type:complete len:426 (-) Transcript_17734:3423-4700(-)
MKSMSVLVEMVCSSVPCIWTVAPALRSMLPSVACTRRLSLVPEAEVDVKRTSLTAVMSKVVSACMTVARASILISSGVVNATASVAWTDTPVVLSSPPALRMISFDSTVKVVTASTVISTSASKRISSLVEREMSSSASISTEPPPITLMQEPSRSRVAAALTVRPVVAWTSISPAVAVRKSFVSRAAIESCSSPAVTNSRFLPAASWISSPPLRVSRKPPVRPSRRTCPDSASSCSSSPEFRRASPLSVSMCRPPSWKVVVLKVPAGAAISMSPPKAWNRMPSRMSFVFAPSWVTKSSSQFHMEVLVELKLMLPMVVAVPATTRASSKENVRSPVCALRLMPASRSEVRTVRMSVAVNAAEPSVASTSVEVWAKTLKSEALLTVTSPLSSSREARRRIPKLSVMRNSGSVVEPKAERPMECCCD